MSAARSILLLGLPGIAVVIGILWYRKRSPTFSDPGGSKKTPNIEKSLSDSEIEIITPVKKSLKINTSSPDPLDKSLKSAPIDIPAGSPIQLTDDQVDLEIQKIQSQKSQGREFTMSSSVLAFEPAAFKSLQASLDAVVFPKPEMSVNAIENATSITEVHVDNIEEEVQVASLVKDIHTDKCDWSEELSELESDANNDSIERGNVRDSAYHSPTENMSASPQLSSYSDQQSEGSSDSGKGSSSLHFEFPGFYEFVLPQQLVGRLIGRHGGFIHLIKSDTRATIVVKRHPDSNKLRLCSIEGTAIEIEAALAMIRTKFPIKRYPNVTLEKINVAVPLSPIELTPECVSLHLVEGVNNDCTVGCVLTGGQISLQQPLHPTFPQLNRLVVCMTRAYAIPEVPTLPPPVTAGIVCACPLDGVWYRAQIIEMITPEEAFIRLVDFGYRVGVHISLLRQIRGDFMTLPFQSVDCILSNVKPPLGLEEWPIEASEILSTVTQNRMLQAQISGFVGDTPLVHLYCGFDCNQVIYINEELIARGLAEWDEGEPLC